MISDKRDILYLLSKTLQIVQLNKTEIIKNKWQWQDFKVSVYIKNTQYSTEQKAIHSELFFLKSTNLILKCAKYWNLQTFVTEIFKVQIGLSPELMIQKPILPANKFAIQARGSKRQKYSIETEKYGIESFFQMNITLSFSL